MSKSRVGSRGFDDGDGRGNEMVEMTCRCDRDVWELRWDVGGTKSGVTNATSALCISKSASMA
jgi:hypothetical protein